MIYLKRAYEKPEAEDGCRVLVDRLWPRGVSKEKAQIDYWLKAAAPSKELRQWFNHDPEKFSEFKEKYKVELKENPVVVEQLLELTKKEKVTLIYGAKNKKMNNAVVLKEVIENLVS
ncbi:DUF488 domain-containing protein [Enterococcus sp. LJL128]|uniref:DUF488 domain-containing protein n=1 Tax=Enterococcus sp. LJL51 TaxID=3416656 RepID=UPI003CEF0D07